MQTAENAFLGVNDLSTANDAEAIILQVPSICD